MSIPSAYFNLVWYQYLAFLLFVVYPFSSFLSHLLHFLFKQNFHLQTEVGSCYWTFPITLTCCVHIFTCISTCWCLTFNYIIVDLCVCVWCMCECVCVSVHVYSGTTGYGVAYKQYKRPEMTVFRRYGMKTSELSLCMQLTTFIQLDGHTCWFYAKKLEEFQFADFS